MIVMCVQDITHARGCHDLCPFSSAHAHNYGNGNGQFRRASGHRLPEERYVGRSATHIFSLLMEARSTKHRLPPFSPGLPLSFRKFPVYRQRSSSSAPLGVILLHLYVSPKTVHPYAQSSRRLELHHRNRRPSVLQRRYPTRTATYKPFSACHTRFPLPTHPSPCAAPRLA